MIDFSITPILIGLFIVLFLLLKPIKIDFNFIKSNQIEKEIEELETTITENNWILTNELLDDEERITLEKDNARLNRRLKYLNNLLDE